MSPVRRTKRINELLTAEQAASRLGVSVATIWRLRGDGKLRGTRVLNRTVFDRTQVETLRAARRRESMAAG